jgi:hypothetical protein
MTEQDTMEAIALASPKIALHMLANWTQLDDEAVLAIARVHAAVALKDATAIMQTAGCSSKQASKQVALLRQHPHPALALARYTGQSK